MNPVDDGHCFACGPHNEHGLRLRFSIVEKGSVEAEITLPSRYQGWRDVAHGGIVMMLLDEAMAHAAGSVGMRGVTAKVSVRFRKPVPLERPLRLHGTVKWMRSSVLGLEATVIDERGSVLASGEGNFVSKGTVAAGELGVPDVASR